MITHWETREMGADAALTVNVSMHDRERGLLRIDRFNPGVQMAVHLSLADMATLRDMLDSAIASTTQPQEIAA